MTRRLVFETRLPGDDARLLANYGVALMYLDDFRGGVAAVERAAASCRQYGAVPTLLFAGSFEVVARLVLGDWQRAVAEAGELHGLAVASENRSELEDFRWVQAYVAAAQGDRGRLAEVAAGTTDERIARCLGLLELGDEAPEAAIAILRPLVVDGAFAGYADPDLAPFDLAEAYLRCGREAEAVALLGAFEPFAERAWAAAALARCRAMQSGADWEALCEESRSGFAAIGFAFEEARSELCFGELLRRDRRRGAAREPLARALATFERLGATPWAARARAGLRATGMDAGAGAATASGGLTERERQVAESAASGRTNKEIGAQLFLSPRTVELHLSSAFRKLGVRRRAELAAHLEPRDVEHDDGVAAHVVLPISPRIAAP